MELQEFIKNTLVGIKNGVNDANKEFAKQEGKELGKDFSALFVLEGLNRGKEGYVSFDVAVTVNSENIKSGGGGINVAALNLGGKVDSSLSQEHISRIKFNILPWEHIG